MFARTICLAPSEKALYCGVGGRFYASTNMWLHCTSFTSERERASVANGRRCVWKGSNDLLSCNGGGKAAHKGGSLSSNGAYASAKGALLASWRLGSSYRGGLSLRKKRHSFASSCCCYCVETSCKWQENGV